MVTVVGLVLNSMPVFAASCSYTPINSTVTGSDVSEYATLPYCYVGPVPCCSVASISPITQDFFKAYRKDFIMNSFYKCPVENNFKSLANEIRNVLYLKMAAFGSFLDASILNDSLREIQVSSAQSVQSYAPSDQICRFGTLSRSLSASDERVNLSRLVLSEIGLTKNLGTKSSISAAGRGQENDSRLKGFVDLFCDLNDNNNGLNKLCQTATIIKDIDLNKDVDYARLLGTGVTINADLTDTNATQDEKNLIALSHFLYGHRQPLKRITITDINETKGSIEQYTEYRSVVARRAAAQNSYNTLAAMKMAGSGASDQYLRATLNQIGLSGGDELKYLGAQNTGYPAVKSSYNSQMNLLTRQVFQDPAFYANLMDSKANVKRTSASLQAIGLMQGRDTYRSMARSEMLINLLVELEARKMINNVQGKKIK